LPGLGDELGFVVVDRGTLQATVAANVFALGDATDVPTSKAGSVAHFQGETLVSNIGRFLEGRELEPSFDGHTNCFIETGFHKALLIDFNYETEPLRGRFPEPHIGPLRLLAESRPSHARDQLEDAGRQEARRHLHEKEHAMTTTTLLDTPVERDPEGFFVHPEQRSEAMADEIARENGITEGIDANLFFTFFGLDAINKAKHDHVKVATVGNPGPSPRDVGRWLPRRVRDRDPQVRGRGSRDAWTSGASRSSARRSRRAFRGVVPS
jgi:hypothetical protein